MARPTLPPQKRVLFFVFDGTGLGHLRRIARIAGAVQGPCAALVVTGLREAAWIVPETCEFLHLPSWNSVRSFRAQYWDRDVWLRLDYADAMKMRQDFLAGAFRTFDPDAVVVDYLPFGRDDELDAVLRQTRAKSYFVLRGIVDTSDQPHLCGEAARAIGEVYDRVLVTADRRVIDVAAQGSYDALTSSKLHYVGYVRPELVDRAAVRETRHLSATDPWVVCSAGGGIFAEAFLHRCIDVAAALPGVAFDVVFGPMSNESRTRVRAIPPNCRVHRECRTLPELHAASDVTVSSGGYNSIMEAAAGGSRLIVFPSRVGDDDEQSTNAVALSRHYPVTLLRSAGELEEALLGALEASRTGPRPVLGLDTEGVARIRDIIFGDLGLEHGDAPGAAGLWHQNT